MNSRKKNRPKIRTLLRTFEPQIMKKIKIFEPRQILSGSYKKKSVGKMRQLSPTIHNHVMPFYCVCRFALHVDVILICSLIVLKYM